MSGFYDEVSGDYGLGLLPITVMLYEGNVTKVRGEKLTGFGESFVQRTAPLNPGDDVEIYDDHEITWDATDGLPVVKALAGTGASYKGRLLSTDPALGVPATYDVAVTDLADLLAGKLLRFGTVVFAGMTGSFAAEVTVPSNGGGAFTLPIADEDKLAYSVGGKKYVRVASGGLGYVPMHHIAGSTSVDVVGKVQIGVGMVKTTKVS